ncbi:hypothetical protein X975_03799, partial [Stegodyphus mimosarum]
GGFLFTLKIIQERLRFEADILWAVKTTHIHLEFFKLNNCATAELKIRTELVI